MEEVTCNELLRAKIVELQRQNSALPEKIALLEQRILQLEVMLNKRQFKHEVQHRPLMRERIFIPGVA
ncbi:MAG: hypothetical protein LBJ96_01390 [Holosporaceae bacterium]|jgi:hypothetical protein|nr:hypothetical protein [Holosporaceae bacterium]